MPSILLARDQPVEPAFALKGKQPDRTGAGPGLTWDETPTICPASTGTQLSWDAYHAHLAKIKAQHGSVQRYILDELLGWSPEDLARQAETSTTIRRRPVDVIQWTGCPHEQSGDRAPREEYFDGEEGQYKVLITPFPYAIPADAQHLIVWCKQPILHPCVLHGSRVPRHAKALAWKHIQQRGLSGLIPPTDVPVATFTGHLLPEVAQAVAGDDDLERQVRLAIFAAARPVHRFVEMHYGRDHEAVFFANPPGLQSVPTLAHFHLMIRKIR